MLYINGTGVGTTGIIDSGDMLNIEVISSDEYNTTVSSTISVLGRTGVFYVTTRTESGADCSLSTTKKLVVQNIYDMLKE